MESQAGRYRRQRILGEGGGGRVWLVEDQLNPGRRVALKELVDTTGREASLRREFATLRTLHHPSLAEVFSFDVGPGHAHFTLEYVDGTDFVTAVRREGSASFIALAAEALRALAFLHDLDILHRDLKPSNILVRARPARGCRVVLLDFGLAISRNESMTTRLAGTAAYLAPELLEGSAPNRRTDLFGLGSVFQEALGDREQLDSRLREWLADLTAPHPDDRPASAHDALVRLKSLAPSIVEIEIPATRSARLASGAPPGREHECERAWKLIESPNTPAVVLLAGDVGMGKSRLLRWLASQAVSMGWDVGADVGRELGEPGASMTEMLDRWRVRALDHASLVLVDELERAPQSVVGFVDAIARDPAGAPVRVVAAARSADIHDETLRKLFLDVGCVPTLHRVDLAPLERDGVRAVARRVLGSGATDEHVDWLLENSGGNPLLLESLLAEGSLEVGAVPRHATLEDAIRTRFESLSDSARRWLRSLVVFGSGATSEALHRLSGIEEAELAGAAEDSVAAGLATNEGLVWSSASRMARDVVGDLIDPEERVRLSRAAATLVQDGDAGRSARLWRDAGERNRSVEHAIRAARLDSSAKRHADAAQWYAFALSQLARSDPRRLSFRRSQADSLADAQLHSRAARALGFLLRRAPTLAERAKLLARRSYLLAQSGRLNLALRMAERALASASDDRLARSSALRSMAAALVRLDRKEEAMTAALEAAHGFAALGEQEDEAASLYLAGMLASNTGRFKEATRYLEQVAMVASASGDHRLHTNAWISLATVATREGDYEESLSRIEKARAIAVKYGLAAQQHFVATTRVTPLTQLGRLDDALSSAVEAESLAAHHGSQNGVATARLKRADLLILLGRGGQAIELLTGALEATEGIEPKFLGYLKVTLAEALLEEPHPDMVRIGNLLRELLDDSLLDRKGLFGALVVEMERRVLAGEAIGGIGERFAAEVEADRSLLEPPWEVRARLAQGQEALAAGVLDRASAVAREAIEIAEARDLPALAARLHAVVSEAEQRAGRIGPAREALDRARGRLDEAASRIADEQMRADFLGRPVFRPIRRSALGRATAAEGRLLAIYEMVRVLNSESDPEVLLETMLDMAIAVVRAERGLILLEGRDGEYAVRASRNVEPDAAADAVGFSRSVVLEAAAGTPVLAIDTGDDPRLRDLRSVSLYQIRSVLCVPLRSRGRRIGAVYLDNRTGGGTFGREDLGFLEAFADHAALALENATARRALEDDNRRLRAATESRARLGGLVGRSSRMQRAYDRIEKLASTVHPVLILGESGTGKELAARAIHALGPRLGKPFLVENCAAVSDSLLESELFGHVRGAFTGAERDRPGLFEQADGGTLFLDEIGDTTPAMQARLLRVLQEGEVRRVGDETRRHVDVRVLTATNKDLDREVAEGRFRDDLRHRLQVLVLELPALRERPGDIAALVDELLERIGRERGGAVPRIRLDVVDRLERYPWPGNVRQLENCLKRLAVLSGDEPITLDVVRSDDGLARMLLGDDGGAQPALRLDHNEKDQIRRALDAAGGNRERAAKLLGISRATIFRKLKEHGLV